MLEGSHRSFSKRIAHAHGLDDSHQDMIDISQGWHLTDVSNPQGFQELLGYVTGIFDLTKDSIDFGHLAALIDGAIATNDDAVAFFNGVSDYLDKFGQAADIIRAGLDIAQRIDVVQNAADPAKALFVQSVDMLAEAGIEAAALGLGFVATELLCGIAPLGALIGYVGGWAAHRAYDAGGSAAVQHQAEKYFDAYIQNHDYITSITDIFIGQKGPNSGSSNLSYNILAGGSGEDSLSGQFGVNILLGGGGNDFLSVTIPNIGNGVQQSNTGTQFLSIVDGGSGMDTAYIDWSRSTQAVIFDGNAAATAAGCTLTDGTVIRNVEQIGDLRLGTGDDVVTLRGHGVQSVTDGGIGVSGGGYDTLFIDYSWAGQGVTAGSDGNSGYVVKVGDGSVDGAYAFRFEEAHIVGGSGNDILYGLAGNNVLTGNGGDDSLAGQGGNDTFDGGSGNDYLDGEGGTNVLLGGTGDDQLIDVGSGSTIDGGSGTDTLTLYRYGLTQAVIFDGNAAATAAGCTLTDGTVIRNVEQIGDLRLGTGDDVVTLRGHGVQSVTDGGIGVSGGGYDTLFIDYSWAGQRVTAGSDGNSGYVVKVGDGSVDGAYAFRFEEAHIVGGSGNDILYGLAGNNVLTGNGGDDSLAGQGGNDTFDGGSGNDYLDGEAGFDTASYADAISGVHIDLAITDSQDTGGAGKDTLYSIENLTGSRFADTLTGDGGENRLHGGGGSDVLIGGGGKDVLTGGVGADRFVFQAIDDSRGAHPDLITDLSSVDRIDFHAIDADITHRGNQSFSLVTGFDAHPGELALSYDAAHDRTILQLDVNGDAVADMTLWIAGEHLDFTHFVL